MALRLLLLAVLSNCMAYLAAPSLTFCGFYVGKIDTTLFSGASQVISVRDGTRSAITMAIRRFKARCDV